MCSGLGRHSTLDAERHPRGCEARSVIPDLIRDPALLSNDFMKYQFMLSLREDFFV
jgi:hypothetical protein